MIRKVFLATTLAVALAARADSMPSIASRLESGWMNGDTAAVRNALATLRDASDAPARRDYAIGYAEYRLAFMAGVTKEEQEKLVTDAVDRFSAVITAEPRNGEAHALLASCLGILISLHPIKAMVYGPRAGEATDRSLEVEPNNPRVLLLAGVSAIHKPSEFGGGVDKAEPLLRRAADILKHEPVDRPWPNWGRFDVHVWLGQVLAKLGRSDEARAEYEAALAIAPGSEYVRAILLPKLAK